MATEQKVGLQTPWLVFWIVIGSLGLLSAFSGWQWLVRACFIVGMIGEGVALYQKRRGDTFSEALDAFENGKPGRRLLVIGFMLGLTVAFWMAGGGPPLVRAILIATFYLWFGWHIFTDLKEA